MAPEAAIAAGESIISTSGVVEVVKNYAKEEFKGLWDLRKNVTELSKTLQSMEADLKVAEERQGESEDIRKWLQKLKNLAYDLEDVRDDYALESPAEDEENMGGITQWRRLAINSLWLLCDVPLSCFGIATPVTPLRNISHRLQSIKKELQTIKKEMKDRVEVNKMMESLGGGASSSETTTPETSTSSADRVWPMVGRYQTKMEIKAALLNSVGARVGGSSPTITVVGIAGFGGMGKTTLARDILSDQELVEKFSFRKWVDVGENFNIRRLMNDIIGGGNQLQNLSDLESKLIDEIKKKRFLIVLDNAWCTDDNEWDKLWRPLTHGEEGGAIVVTARNQTVARAIARGPAYSEHLLGEMPEEECLEILKRSALKGRKTEGYHLRELQCKQIVKKMKGVPLAAVIMGRFLGTRLDNDESWMKVVTVWSPNDEEELVHQVIGLSYRHLHSHLKPCFAYCSIFPKGFIFDKETLVRMWVAQGYIQPLGNQLLEHIGSDYFYNLCQMSFFQIQSDEFGDVRYVMHDLIHDYAQRIFVEGRQDIGGGDCEVVRHLSLDCHKFDPILLQKLGKFKKLRTLIISNIDDAPPVDFLGDVLGEFKYMRVLVLKCWKISEFPEPIGHLKLLRYLDISETGVEAVPELVCGLLHLQVLKLPQFWGPFCNLPEGTSKLVNLRCLDGVDVDLANLKHIGRLISLQELTSFHAQKNRGSRIEELGSLNSLHKVLWITGLENVQSQEEALQAKLKDKEYLEELRLEWDYERWENVGEEQRSIDSQVLEGLSPPPNLKGLEINGNLGAQPPSWMMEQYHRLPSTLVSVSLYGCPHWECLPALGQLPLLRKLSVDGEHDVKKVGQEFFCATDHAFPRLEVLRFSNMEEWEGWDYMPCRRVFTSLHELHVEGCPKLASLSPILRHMTTLRELTIKNCAQLSSLEEDGGDWMFASLRSLEIFSCPRLTSLSPILRDLTALEKLDIWKCDQLSSLLVPPILPSLDYLEIKSCPMLKELATLPSSSQKQQEENDYGDQSLPSSSFPRLKMLDTDNRCLLMWILRQKLRSLQRLKIVDSHGDLICFTEAEEEGWAHLTSLTDVTFHDCPHLQTLPSSLRTLPSLFHLNLERCPEINRLPEGALPASLEKLYMIDCSHLQTLPSSLRTLPSLVQLKLVRCPEINRLPEGALPASLQKLYIIDCSHLQTLPSSFYTLSSLVYLKLKRCPEINHLPEGSLPASLQELYMIDCPHLQTLPSSLHTLPSLFHLKLKCCPEINRLPEGGLPASLRELYIIDCPKLAESCREGGPDHHKISYNTLIFVRIFNNNSDATSEEDRSDAESEEDVAEPKEDE